MVSNKAVQFEVFNATLPLDRRVIGFGGFCEIRVTEESLPLTRPLPIYSLGHGTESVDERRDLVCSEYGIHLPTRAQTDVRPRRAGVSMAGEPSVNQ